MLGWSRYPIEKKEDEEWETYMERVSPPDWSFEDMHPRLFTKEIIKKHKLYSLRYIQLLPTGCLDEEICELSILQSPMNLKHIPKYLRTEKVCSSINNQTAVGSVYLSTYFRYLPNKFKTQEMCDDVTNKRFAHKDILNVPARFYTAQIVKRLLDLKDMWAKRKKECCGSAEIYWGQIDVQSKINELKTELTGEPLETLVEACKHRYGDDEFGGGGGYEYKSTMVEVD
jgi:hypothetical protein